MAEHHDCRGSAERGIADDRITVTEGPSIDAEAETASVTTTVAGPRHFAAADPRRDDSSLESSASLRWTALYVARVVVPALPTIGAGRVENRTESKPQQRIPEEYDVATTQNCRGKDYRGSAQRRSDHRRSELSKRIPHRCRSRARWCGVSRWSCSTAAGVADGESWTVNRPPRCDSLIPRWLVALADPSSEYSSWD